MSDLSRRARRAAQRQSAGVEEEQLAAELAELPDDEGMYADDFKQSAPVALTGFADLRKRHVEISHSIHSTEDQEGSEEDEEEDEAADLQPLPEEHLVKRPGRRAEAGEEGARQHETDNSQPPAKRVRFDETAPAVAPAPPSTNSDGVDQVTAALHKISSHIGNPSKFPKASPLLRQLLDSGTLTKPHHAACFAAIKSAFSLKAAKSKHLVDPTNRKEVLKLFLAIESHVDLFTRAERAQLDVYRIVGAVRNEMQTDDSFAFSKVMAKVRELVDEMEESTPDEDWAYERLMAAEDGIELPLQPPHLQQQQQQAQEQQPKQEAAAADDPFNLDALMSAPQGGQDAAAEDDPFGLNALVGAPAAAAQRKPKAEGAPQQPGDQQQQAAASGVWSSTEAAAARRRAVLDCVQHARTTFHKLTWARSSIEVLGEHCYEQRSKFCASQQQELAELRNWVLQQRALRKQGPSAREINRDSTSFERARADWSRATLSARGKVGAKGDAKSANWLG